MKTKTLFMLALILALVLATGVINRASAGGAVVPFKAYYPVTAVAVFDPSCMCLQQTFTPGGNGMASHMGLSLFYGHAQAWQDDLIIQKGTGTLVAANGDSIYVYYEGEAMVLPDGQHISSDGWFTVTGGTGRFAGVTGGGKYRVYVYMSGEQPNDLWFEGVLNKD